MKIQLFLLKIKIQLKLTYSVIFLFQSFKDSFKPVFTAVYEGNDISHFVLTLNICIVISEK